MILQDFLGELVRAEGVVTLLAITPPHVEILLKDLERFLGHCYPVTDGAGVGEIH